MDYAKRWGIECRFSDLKSRGFGLAQPQLQHADRIERLMLIMALALYYAVSCRLWDAKNNPIPCGLTAHQFYLGQLKRPKFMRRLTQFC